MKRCSFELNEKPMSSFILGASTFPAFSGLGSHVNKKIFACVPSQGPIPPGEYFIVDRESGGRFGWLYDLFSGRSDWFALYANDGNIDDGMWCAQVKRGRFRLHPKGPRGVSEGCITLDEVRDFQILNGVLRAGRPAPVENKDFSAWGRVRVR